MIHVSVITASISRKAGGLFASVRKLTQAASRARLCMIQVFSFTDEHTVEDRAAWQPLEPYVCARSGLSFFPTSKMMKHAVLAASPDILHCHGIWLYPSLIDLAAKREIKTPYVVSPRGMLDAWALKNSAWKKKLAGWLFENRHLRSAACIHALCESEYQSIRAYGLKNPVAIIPNGIDLPDLSAEQRVPPWSSKVGADKKVLLYLGRIHPKKGLENLIEAWSILKNAGSGLSGGWRLVIAGWSQGGHEQQLKWLTQKLGLTNSISFAGPLYGEAKDAALRSAKVFILPSFSEGLPMSVLEAWSYSLPVLMTRFCNIPEGFGANAAIEIQPQADSIAEGLKKFIASSTDDQRQIGQNGVELVKDTFTWPKIATQMVDVYKWVLGQSEKPEFVRLD